MPRSNLGTYLYSSRVMRGQSNIAAYLQDYGVKSVSESYYRDIETGRKSIRIETALILCGELNLEQRKFFALLLKDIIPDELFTSLIKPDAANLFESAEAEVSRLRLKLDQTNRAFMHNIGDNIREISEEVVEALEEKIDWLPVIHFIYMRQSCTFSELARILRQNAIVDALDEVLSFLKNYELALVDDKKQLVVRHAPLFRIPASRKGSQFKDRFLMLEIQKSLQKERRKSLGEEGTWSHSSIACLKSSEASEALLQGVSQLIAQIEARETALEDEDARPMFTSILFSSREEYA
jgi:hypothetical protein